MEPGTAVSLVIKTGKALIAAGKWYGKGSLDDQLVETIKQNDREVLDPLGCGIVRPFIRTPRADFDNAAGIEEVLSCVGQVLGTPKGSLPWRPDFGSELHRLRHQNLTAILADTARVLVDEAPRKWEPRAGLVSVTDDSSKNELALRVTVKIAGIQRAVRVPLGSL